MRKFMLLFVLLASLSLVSLPTQPADAEIIEKLTDRNRGVRGVEHPEEDDTSISDVFPPFDDDRSSFVGGPDYRFNSTQDWVDAFTGAQKKITRPRFDIILSRNSPGPNETLFVLAQPQNFESLYLDMYFNWCIGNEEQRISQNGLLAGGERLLLIDNGDDCYSPVSRIPVNNNDVDTDNNGLGDRWETRYFGSTGADPTADLDKDGYLVDNTNGIIGPDGVVILAPDVVAGGRTYQSCDELFTNAEEYVWGTNPLDPDTDHDGRPDGADTCGRGEIGFEFTAPPNVQLGDRELIEVIGTGVSVFRGNEGRVEQVKISNAGKEIYYGVSDELKARMSYRIVNDEAQQNQETRENQRVRDIEAYVNDEIEFFVDIDNALAREGNIHYEWNFRLLDGGVDNPLFPGDVIADTGKLPQQYGEVDPTIARNGYGLNPYRLRVDGNGSTGEAAGFDITPKVGNVIVAEVTAIEPETGRSIKLSKAFNVSLPISFEYSPELPVLPFLPLAAEETAPEYTVTAVVPTDQGSFDEDAFLFEWYIDDIKQPNAAIGGSSISFPATKPAGQYKIRLAMTKVSDETEFARIEEEAVIGDAAEARILNCDAFLDSAPQVGQSVDLNGAFSFGGTYPEALNYTWTINGNVFQENQYEGSQPSDSITFVPNTPGSYSVNFTIESLVPEDLQNVEYQAFSSTDTCALSVYEGDPTLEASARNTLASVVAAFPEFVRSASKFLVIFSLIVGFVLLARYGISKRGA